MNDETIKKWKECWEEDFFPWHSNVPNPFLQRHLKLLAQGNFDGKRILVPLCGKTKDLKWLHEQGLDVVGIELSEIACKNFFEENELTYTIEKHVGYNVYRHDKQLCIFQGDLFALTCRELGGLFHLWWDFGGLVAMKGDDYHKKYVKHILTLVEKESFRLLMAVFEYNSAADSLLPESISFIQLKDFFGDSFKLDLLEEIKEAELPEVYNVRLGNNAMHKYFLIKAK